MSRTKYSINLIEFIEENLLKRDITADYHNNPLPTKKLIMINQKTNFILTANSDIFVLRSGFTDQYSRHLLQLTL